MRSQGSHPWSQQREVKAAEALPCSKTKELQMSTDFRGALRTCNENRRLVPNHSKALTGSEDGVLLGWREKTKRRIREVTHKVMVLKFVLL